MKGTQHFPLSTGCEGFTCPHYLSVSCQLEGLQMEVEQQRVAYRKAVAEFEADQRRVQEACDDRLQQLKTSHQVTTHLSSGAGWKLLKRPYMLSLCTFSL